VSGTKTKILIGGTVLIAAVAYLGIRGARAGASYYTDVDTYVTDPNFQSCAVRLHGKVAEKDLVIDSSNTAASFRLEGVSHSLPVNYRGVLPDLFKAGCEVVVRGQKDDKGIFQAEQILTKCASKYAPEGNASRRPT
jgi:cytochrome c-type biogenesis protein CcmE